MIVEVRDEVSGYCPACQSSDITFVCVSISGNNSYEIHKYALRCKHQDVCWRRRDYLGNGGE